MSDFSIQVRKFQKNPLLMRKQFCVDVIHANKPSVSKKDLQNKIANMFKVKETKSIILFGFKTAFGGSRSTGFGLIYDSLAAAKRFEQRYRLARMGVVDAPVKSGRRGRKETKNKAKKHRGKEKSKILHKK
eukprot:GHVR01043724.1.p1 GENE.GHVR01043724.1~~GHVR01043724.1.p1  ORF type:complete len:131 (-),score=26.62 GHVR01043724.1:113-505(-)